jgi:ferredoxin
MQVKIERDECISCAACWEECPDFFEQNPADNLSQVVEKYRRRGDPALGDSPSELEDCVRQAAESCPVEIIHLE